MASGLIHSTSDINYEFIFSQLCLFSCASLRYGMPKACHFTGHAETQQRSFEMCRSKLLHSGLKKINFLSND